jgi:hypothetical protein
MVFCKFHKYINVKREGEDDGDWVKACQRLEVGGRKVRGRVKKM